MVIYMVERFVGLILGIEKLRKIRFFVMERIIIENLK